MSLLLTEGHTHARKYPLAVLWQESQIARERLNQQVVTNTVLLDAVVTAHMTKGKKGRENLTKLLKELGNGR